MIPLIIMSTVAGTANFAQNTFPEIIRPNVPQIIGSINLISAIMTTIYNFLKISEFMESHRISSINYGKLARTITVELNLPVKDRSSGGAECVKIARTEIDRLIEQSPSIPKTVLLTYESTFAGTGLSEPEIVVINKVDIFEDQDNKIATTIAEAGMKLKNAISLKKKNIFQNMVSSITKSNASNSPTIRSREKLNNELNEVSSSKIVSRLGVKPLLERLIGMPKELKPPPFPEIIEQVDIESHQSPEIESHQSPEIESEYEIECHQPREIESEHEIEEVSVEIPENDIEKEMEFLKQSKIVKEQSGKFT